MKIAIIGAGISGIVAAHSLQKSGHETVIFEKSTEAGGVWALGYPGVRLQNTGLHYRLSDFPWPFAPDLHPTSGQVRSYLNQAIKALRINVRTNHEVVSMLEKDKGWTLKYKSGGNENEESFDYVVVAIGQYTEGKHRPEFPGQSDFKGEIITEREVNDLDVFENKRVAVVGFGKSAVDMATFAVERARRVTHVFRTPRWLIPFHICGIHYAKLMFCRMSSVFMPSWAYPTAFEKFLHQKTAFMVRGIWEMIAIVIRMHCYVYGLGKSKLAKKGLKAVQAQHYIVSDWRSAAAMAPEFYYPYVAEGKIEPVHAALIGFTEQGIRLGDGSVIECDQVVLSLGSEAPRFPFFPKPYRQMLEAEKDGVQLFRHLLHPRIPNVAFAGFNHGFMHVPAAEVGMLWLAAYLNGDLQMPSVREMEKSIAHILQWKREYINFEPSRSCAVNTRFQQYIDIILKDLGLSPYRKLPNIFAEAFSQYGAADYQGLTEEYLQKRKDMVLPRALFEADT